MPEALPVDVQAPAPQVDQTPVQNEVPSVGDFATFDEMDKSTEPASTQKRGEKSKEKVIEKINDELKTAPKDGEQKPQAKTYKVKYNGQEVAVAADMALPVTIDGKVTEVPVQELMNNYSGKTNWDKKYGELSQERKALETDRTTLQGAVNKIYQLGAVDKNPMGMIYYLAETMGLDPRKTWDDIKTQIRNAHKLQDGSELSETEVKLKEREQELEYYRSKDSEKSKAEAQRTKEQELNQKIDQSIQKLGIKEDEWLSLHDELIKKEGFKKEQVTPELVEQYHAYKGASTIATQIVDKINPDYEKKSLVVDYLTKTKMDNPTWTEKDLKDIANSVMGNAPSAKSAEKLSKKIQRSAPNTVIKKTLEPQREYLSFDEVE